VDKVSQGTVETRCREIRSGSWRDWTRADVVEFLGYLEHLREAVEPAVTEGQSLEQAIAEIRIPAKYAGYRFQNFFSANVQKMYAELKAAQLAVSPRGKREIKRVEPEVPQP